ncbi:MAG: AAA family ATPase [Alphaproteobacteria bacterium]|nr:AAA family ATPase [Alphaproteobacteria bacterium]
MTVPAQRAAIDWLKSGSPWGKKPDVAETHAALVFLVGDQAFKLKKAVDLGYLNFTTLESRRETLARELTLNRRTAPNLYLRTLPVSRAASGELNLKGEGEAVDWLLEMRRFPDDALLSTRADRGELTDAVIEDLAEHVAQFHDAAEIVQVDWAKAAARIADENTSDLRSQSAALSPELVESAVAARSAAAGRCVEQVNAQSHDVRRCHGDMHLGNVFLDHGEPTLFDCIEFNDFYATIPPLYDVAFLLMDLLARGQGRLANRALNAWLIHRDTGKWHETVESLKALPLYLALRAEIRAKTEGRKPNGLESARHYLELVKRFAEQQPPRLLAIGGFSGTGKSSVAKEVAWRIGAPPGAVHLRSDEIRKRLAGAPLDQRLPQSEYTPAKSATTYTMLEELARGALAAGRSVIVDAVFAREDERRAIRSIAEASAAPFVGIWLEAPREILEQRLSSRRGDVSDADISVLHKQLKYDIGHMTWHHVDASGDVAAIAGTVMRHLA